MTEKFPESSFINPPHEVKGTPKEAMASFYEFAKKRIKYFAGEEMIALNRDTGDIRGTKYIPAAFFILIPESYREGDDLEKWVSNLDIAVNKDAFKIKGKDYTDLIPFVLEHEIHEAWLDVKKGTGPALSDDKKHVLAHRRAFLLAEQQGLGDKFLEWMKLVDPDSIKNIKQSEYALQVAKKQLGHLKEKK